MVEKLMVIGKQINNNLKRNILHIITGLSTGGAERALVKLIQSSDKKKFVHSVISLKDLGTQGEIIKEIGVQVYPLNINGVLSAIKGIRKLRVLVKTIKPDLLHAWMYHGALFALFAGFRGPKVMGVRHSLHNIALEKRSMRWIMRFLAKRSFLFDAIIYNSLVSKSQHQQHAFCNQRSIVIANGFDTQLYVQDKAHGKTLKKKLNLIGADVVFGHAARYHPMKNHKGLITSFASALKQSSNVKLLTTGSGVDENNLDLTSLVRELDISDSVFLLGEQKDMVQTYNALDVFVSSSAWGEAFPNVLGEAMSCGIPCIATDVGDSAAIIGDTGIVVPPNDNDALAKAMVTMAQMPREERKSLGQKARQRIIEKFRLEVVTKQYEELYLRLLENHSH